MKVAVKKNTKYLRAPAYLCARPAGLDKAAVFFGSSPSFKTSISWWCRFVVYGFSRVQDPVIFPWALRVLKQLIHLIKRASPSFWLCKQFLLPDWERHNTTTQQAYSRALRKCLHYVLQLPPRMAVETMLFAASTTGHPHIAKTASTRGRKCYAK